MFLSCGTGAWRVRSSMNTMSECMGLTCTADIGLMSINYTCFDSARLAFRSLFALLTRGVNNSKLTRLEIFINDFVSQRDSLTCEQVHNELDDIEKIHGLYSAACFGPCGGTCLRSVHIPAWRWTDRDDMCIFRCRHWQLCASKFTKHHLTLVLGIVASVSAACLSYAGLFELAKILFNHKNAA